MSSRGQLKTTITHSAEIRDDEGNLLGYQPVGHVNGNIIEKETLRGGGASIVSSYRAENREEHDFDPEDIDGGCSLRVNPKEKRYAVTFPSIWLGNGSGTTVMTVKTKDFQKTVTEPFSGIEPGI